MRKVKKTINIILACIGALLIAVIATLSLASGVFQPQKYMEPWRKDYALQYDDPRVQLAAHGLLAANGHNMQPWNIVLDEDDPNAFYLYVDTDRLTNEVDPLARQMMITQGTFLEYVKIAGDELGYPAAIELFPEGEYDEQNLADSMEEKPVAKIELTKENPHVNPLYGYMFLPDTNRAAYGPEALTQAQIDQLEMINTEDTMAVQIFQDNEDMEKLGGYAMAGARIESGISRIMAESEFRANERQKNKYRYGYSVEGQGTAGIMRHIMQGMVTLFPNMNGEEASAQMFIQSTQTSVDNTPAYAMIITDDNSRENQVLSGMLYSRLVLTAHQNGLVMQPLSQVLEEYPEMEAQYQSIHSEYARDGGTIQMLVRLGRPTKDTPLTMRQDVMDLVAGER